MKEIGKRLGLTESGVCRVHSEALRKLRIQLKDFDVPSHPEPIAEPTRKRRSNNKRKSSLHKHVDP